MQITPLYVLNYNFTKEDNLLLRDYWLHYHAGNIPLTDVKETRIMQQLFTSNKNYDKYDLFIPNNLK